MEFDLSPQSPAAGPAVPMYRCHRGGPAARRCAAHTAGRERDDQAIYRSAENTSRHDLGRSGNHVSRIQIEIARHEMTRRNLLAVGTVLFLAAQLGVGSAQAPDSIEIVHV